MEDSIYKPLAEGYDILKKIAKMFEDKDTAAIYLMLGEADRSIADIANEFKISKEEAKQIVDVLVEEDIVKYNKANDTAMLTPEVRDIYNRIKK